MIPTAVLMKTADWVIDMGPEGGGGVVAEGTPEGIVKSGKGHTALFLKEVLARRPIKGGEGGAEGGGGVEGQRSPSRSFLELRASGLQEASRQRERIN